LLEHTLLFTFNSLYKPDLSARYFTEQPQTLQLMNWSIHRKQKN